MTTRLVFLLTVLLPDVGWAGEPWAAANRHRPTVVNSVARTTGGPMSAVARTGITPGQAARGEARGGAAAGETIGVAALVESDTTLYSATGGPLVVDVAIDATPVDLGDSVVDGGLDQRFSARASYVEGAHPIPDVVMVTVTSEDSFGAPTPWIPSGVTLPGGEAAKVWRFDAGALQAVVNPLVPTEPFAVRSSVVQLHDSLGNLIVSFDLGTGEQSTPEFVAGVVRASLVDEFGVTYDIAGYDLASMTVVWELDEAVFVDGFESGGLGRW